MNYLHYEFDAGPEDLIEVTLDHAANVQLLSPGEFANYKAGRPFNYYGGHVTTSPFHLAPPHHGHWHLVIDLGGSAGRVRAAARVISRVAG